MQKQRAPIFYFSQQSGITSKLILEILHICVAFEGRWRYWPFQSKQEVHFLRGRKVSFIILLADIVLSFTRNIYSSFNELLMK